MAAAPTSTSRDAGATSSGRATKLFVGGLTRNTTTKVLREHFGQYGRILDCIAMMQPDGKPRGFGYVTLDSPGAADRCLAEPQLIDGRVVDLKRAVRSTAKQPAASREGQAAGARWESASACLPGAWPAAVGFQAASATPWASAAWQQSLLGAGPDCVELLRAAAAAHPQGAWGIADHAAWCGSGTSHGTDVLRAASLDVSPLPLATERSGLSADAPAFVPRDASTGREEPQKVALPSAVGARPLGDITNKGLCGGKLSSPIRLAFGSALSKLSSPAKLPVPMKPSSTDAAPAPRSLLPRLCGRSSNFEVFEGSEDELAVSGHGELSPESPTYAAGKLYKTTSGLVLPPGLENLVAGDCVRAAKPTGLGSVRPGNSSFMTGPKVAVPR